jgi:putative chitinase
VIDQALIRLLSPRLTIATAKEVAESLWAGCIQYGISTERRVAAFLGQCCHESGGFRTTEENLNYRASRLLEMFPNTPRRPWGFISLADAENTVAGGPRSIANRIYGTRMGNRPGTDDGFDFRGSGYIQLTGREAFENYEGDTGEPVTEHPDEVRKLPLAATTACWVFGAWKNCNPLADRWEITTIGALINGVNPPYHNKERIELSEKALEWLEGA